MDAAPPHSAELTRTPVASEYRDLPIDELWRDAHADSVDLTKDELAAAMLAIGAKYNYGLAPGARAGRSQAAAFWRTLHLEDLALAHACALGRETAWQQFITRFREPLTQAAIGITGSARPRSRFR